MQVIVWDITKAQEQQDRRDRREAEESTPKEDKEKNKVVKTPVVLFALLSTMETSHTGIVSDIHWLPKDFAVTFLPNSKSTSTASLLFLRLHCHLEKI